MSPAELTKARREQTFVGGGRIHSDSRADSVSDIAGLTPLDARAGLLPRAAAAAVRDGVVENFSRKPEWLVTRLTVLAVLPSVDGSDLDRRQRRIGIPAVKRRDD